MHSLNDGGRLCVVVEHLEQRTLFAHVPVIVPDATSTAVQAERAPHLRLEFGDGSVRFGRITDGTSNT